MASFRDICFTPAEFATIAKIDRNLIPTLESSGLLKTMRKRVGNVDRKMITLEEMQNFFRVVRSNPQIDLLAELAESEGDHAGAASEALLGRRGDQSAATENGSPEAGEAPVAAATDEEREAKGVADRSAVRMIPGARNPHHKIQMFYNVKGGTGKSTLTAQYVMRASMLGLNVLAIDLDGQGHLTVNLDILDGHERPTIYDVLINDLPVADAIMNVAPGLDLVPANLGLCNIEIPLNNKPRREYRLSEALAKIADRYDLIVADTNPAASILNGSMLVASHLVNVVCATNPLSFHGMSLVMATIEGMEREFKRELDVRIVPNLYDNREVISQEVLGELRAQFPENCTQAVVNRCADLNEATKRRTTVWDVNSRGVAATDINGLTDELLFN